MGTSTLQALGKFSSSGTWSFIGWWCLGCFISGVDRLIDKGFGYTEHLGFGGSGIVVAKRLGSMRYRFSPNEIVNSQLDQMVCIGTAVITVML